jgi:hypothetical protein
MADSLIRQVALVSESPSINFDQVSQVSAALQKQATRDFGPVWNVQATVDAFARLEDVPLGYWPMIVRDDIGENAGGFHTDNNGQPFALIASTTGADWQLAASHECLEMLADPFGNRTMAGDSPKSDQGRVEILIEVCDPCEAAEFGYAVNGVLVSDFYTPRYFDPVFSTTGVQYSFRGFITEPRQVLQGGYLSWHEPQSDHWWQETWLDDGGPKFVDLGKLSSSNGSIREQIDRLGAKHSAKAMQSKRIKPGKIGLQLT